MPKAQTVVKHGSWAAVAVAAALAGHALAPSHPVNVTGQVEVFKSTGGVDKSIYKSHNLVVAGGWRQLWKLFANKDSVHFDTLSFIQVGTDTTTADTGQSTMRAGSHAQAKVDSLHLGTLEILFLLL